MATKLRNVHTFRGGDYVASLMAELSRAAIAQRIATARKQAGLDQRELADLMRVHWRTVQDWESVKKQATPWDRLDELAQVTGVTKDWLLHGERENEVDAAQLAHRLEALEGEVTEAVSLIREALELLREVPAQEPVARRSRRQG